VRPPKGAEKRKGKAAVHATAVKLQLAEGTKAEIPFSYMIEEADSFSAEEESEGVAFIVDTGATATLLSLQAAERLAAPEC
jgi:hypothetical protein